MHFSDRIGKTSPKSIIQVDSIDDDLKNKLWNGIYIFYFKLMPDDVINFLATPYVLFLRKIWTDFFKNRIDEIPLRSSEIKSHIKNFFFSNTWYEVYNLIEYFPNTFEGNENFNVSFCNYCNAVFEEELSGYRFLDKKLIPITSELELKSLENSKNIGDEFNPVKIHLLRAQELLSDRKNPDYRNSIKESISAVESYCKIITNDNKATLGAALKTIEKNINIHEALKKSFSNLYGFTNDAEGIRHALLDEPTLGQEDAIFMLISCSTFINYLVSKSLKIQ